MQNVFGLVIKDCESVVHCTQSSHTDVLAGGDEFAAAFESRVAHFELYDGVRLLLSVIIGDEESISEPQESSGATSIGCARVPPAGRRAVDADAPTCPDSGMTSRRACRCRTSRRTSSTFRARGCGGRAQCAGRSPHGTAPYTWSYHSPMSTRESLSAQLIYPLPSVCTRCASRHSLPLRLSATSQLAYFPSGPFSPEHTSSVSESLMWHTLHTNGDVSCGALYTSRRSPALSRTRIARTTLLS